MDEIDLMLWTEKVKDYYKGTKIIISNIKNICVCVGQFTMALQGELKMEKDYKDKSK